jgi:hypothetical protein
MSFLATSVRNHAFHIFTEINHAIPTSTDINQAFPTTTDINHAFLLLLLYVTIGLFIYLQLFTFILQD